MNRRPPSPDDRGRGRTPSRPPEVDRVPRLRRGQRACARCVYCIHAIEGHHPSLGVYEIANSRTVTILWEEGGVSNQQGEITEEQWEILKLAFVGSGRITILSDQEDKRWMYDYRFLEALRG